jgi:hypothetical protein
MRVAASSSLMFVGIGGRDAAHDESGALFYRAVPAMRAFPRFLALSLTP